MRELKIACKESTIKAYTFNVSACSQLVRKFQNLGVVNYGLTSYTGSGYLGHYSEYHVDHIPVIYYKKNYLIPLLFKKISADTCHFTKDYQVIGFLYLVDWYLSYEPTKLFIRKNLEEVNPNQEIIDSDYVRLRLSEILDKSAYHLRHLKTIAEFENWNEKNRLIDNHYHGKHSRVFDWQDAKNIAELKVILSLVELKYGPMSFDWTMQEQA
ncbi:MAG: hypothetical protein ACK5MW_02550 [Enterococcus sp.]